MSRSDAAHETKRPDQGSDERLAAPADSAPRFSAPQMGVPQFGAVNWIGVGTLARREIIRFVKVYGQTLGAPVATAALFLAVFTFALSGLRGEIAGLPYIEFLAPGVVMMTVIQNAFANTSSSVMIAKIQGSIVDSLMPPLTSAELTFGFMIGGVARGVILALVCAAVLFPIAGVGLAYPLWALFFTLAGATMLALLGVIAGVWAQKFDHMASITNFIITPLSFLSGTFYSIEALPPTWAAVSHWNPFFYLIDGFRYGVVGVGDANPWIGALVSLALITALWGACWRLFETGYRLKG